ncbi:hypothetical protein ABKN59_005141 [Abortiporus biennis]
MSFRQLLFTHGPRSSDSDYCFGAEPRFTVPNLDTTADPSVYGQISILNVSLLPTVQDFSMVLKSHFIDGSNFQDTSWYSYYLQRLSHIAIRNATPDARILGTFSSTWLLLYLPRPGLPISVGNKNTIQSHYYRVSSDKYQSAPFRHIPIIPYPPHATLNFSRNG